MNSEFSKFETHQSSENFPLTIFPNYTDSIFIYSNYHREIEIVYIAEGETDIQIDDRIHTVSSGQAVMINSGDIHVGRPHQGVYCSAEAIVFDLGMLSLPSLCGYRYIEPFLGKAYRFPELIDGKSPWQRTILEIIRTLIREYSEKSLGYELSITIGIFQIILEIIKNQKYETKSVASQRQTARIRLLKRSLDYIADNYQRKFTVRELAEEVQMVENTFYRFFKSLTKTTPTEYILAYRISMAAQQLLNTKLSVLDVALNAGFEDVSYFIRVFKKAKGQTPRKFRLQNGSSGILPYSPNNGLSSEISANF